MKTLLGFLLLAGTAAPQEEGPAVDFVRDIQPILRESCWKCHGAEKQKRQLRLDSKPLALKGSVNGKVIIPGKSGESRLVQLLVEGNPEERMPQEADPLPLAKIALIRKWIDAGAPWPDDASVAVKVEKHWAHLKPVRREPPAVRNAAWVRNPVDAFIAAEHERLGLRPRPEAPRHVLLRRLSLDLIGLAPTPEELAAFLADGSGDAYEKAVDRLLSDARYGERWGRHWMDVWRYSDWAGYNQEVRDSQKHVWRWRDWIVESLNADKGYDRMVLEMLAGDEIAPDDPGTLRATGFLVRNWYKFNRNVWLQNTVEHTAKAFLATTMNCARCHDHMFDPIGQEEYFAFRAFFEAHQVRTDHVPGQLDVQKDGLARAFDADAAAPTYFFIRGDDQKPDKTRTFKPAVPAALGGSPLKVDPVALPPAASNPEKRDFVVRLVLEASEAELAQARAKLEAALLGMAGLEQAAAAEGDAAKAKQALQAALEELPLTVMGVSIGEAKLAGLVAALAAEALEDAGKKEADGWKKAATEALTAQRKQALLEARRNQLVARRAVGKAKPAELAAAKKRAEDADKALVKAEKDASEPSGTAYAKRKTTAYPAASTGRRLALASWIADRENPLTARVAVNHVWLRHFGKALVPTVFEFGRHGRPPSHPALLDWLAVEFMDRGWSMKKLHRFLVTSSAYRMDSAPDAAALAIDPDNRALWRFNARRMEAELVRDGVLHVAGQLDPSTGGPDLDHAQGLAVKRRSLYFRHAAEKQMEFLAIFDAANVSECYERSESIVPQQALALANSPLALEQARLLARRLDPEAAEPAAFVARAFERILGRGPSAEERAECEKFLVEQAALLADKSRLTTWGAGAASKVPPSDDPRLRAREDLVHVLLNHHEFVTIR